MDFTSWSRTLITFGSGNEGEIMLQRHFLNRLYCLSIANKLQRLCPAHSNMIRRKLFQIAQYTAHCNRPLTPFYPVAQLHKTYCNSREHSIEQSNDSLCLSRVQIQRLAKQMRERAGEVDKMALSVPLQTIAESIDTLIGNGFSEDECLYLANNPVVIKNIPNFTHLYAVLIQYGFQAGAVTDMLRKAPELVQLKEQQLIARFESLRVLGFTNGSLESIAAKTPHILTNDLQPFAAKFSLLREFFKASDVLEVLEKSPELLHEDVKAIEAKIMYAKTKMDATNRQMLNSHFFQHSLRHIETRHMFVVKAGFFRIGKKKEGQIDTNPLLREILDTSDETFAKMFGNMTAKDYRTFKKLYWLEKQDELSQGEVLETDDDEDSD